MRPTNPWKRSRALFALPIALAALLGGTRSAVADDPDVAAQRERCATRLSIAILGTSPSAALLASASPQNEVDGMLADPAFVERFARFTNAALNDRPGRSAAEDATYFVALRVLRDRAPWRNVFVGPYGFAADGENVTVTDDAEGLGYFRSDAWLRRYAGNEKAGYKITTAYRILGNVVGLRLVAVTNTPDADVSAKGREAAQCRGCHYDNWYALDKVARVLTKRVGSGAEMTFEPPAEGPQQVLGGATVKDDKELVNALVASVDFRFHACRLAFEYLTGRPENECEGRVFDSCMQALEKTGMIQSALGAIAKSEGFCR